MFNTTNFNLRWLTMPYFKHQSIQSLFYSGAGAPSLSPRSGTRRGAPDKRGGHQSTGPNCSVPGNSIGSSGLRKAAGLQIFFDASTPRFLWATWWSITIRDHRCFSHHQISRATLRIVGTECFYFGASKKNRRRSVHLFRYIFLENRYKATHNYTIYVHFYGSSARTNFRSNFLYKIYQEIRPKKI